MNTAIETTSLKQAWTNLKEQEPKLRIRDAAKKIGRFRS